jgi:hypothetical protein
VVLYSPDGRAKRKGKLVRLIAATMVTLAVGIFSTAATATTDICPLQAACYYPTISVSVNPSTINTGETSLASFSVNGGDPAQGCYKSGEWSGNISLDGSGNASGSQTVGPYGSAGTHSFGVICPASPEPGSGYATLTVNAPSPPPPPPPPPPTMPPEYLADPGAGMGGLEVVYLNSGGTPTRCLTNSGSGGSQYWVGRWPYKRKVIQNVWLCGPAGGDITSTRVETSQTNDPLCHPRGTQQYRVSGGVGSRFVRYFSRAYFECDAPAPIIWFHPDDSVWIDVSYNTNGTASLNGSGRN